jgi:regulatory protein
VSRALDAALNFLSYRPRTGYEVRRKLVSRGFGPETVEAAMHRLSAVGLVDDAAFVSAYVRDRVAHRPTGVRRQQDELYTKGVPHEAAAPLIEAALHEEGTDERALARRVAERKCQSAAARRQDPRVLRRQVRDHLARRGFNLRIIHEVLDELVPRSARNADEA